MSFEAGTVRRWGPLGPGDSSSESPVAVLWLFATGLTLTIMAVLTGSIDVTIPTLASMDPFPIARQVMDVAGWFGLFLYILAHNFGIALVVPTLGLAFAAFEPSRRNQYLIVDIMVASTALALVWGPLAVDLDWDAHVTFLFLVEALGVLLVSLGARRALRSLIRRGRLNGRAGIGAGFRAAIPFIAASLLVLAYAALAEVLFISGAVRLMT